MIWEPASLARDPGRDSSQKFATHEFHERKFVEFVAAPFGVDATGCVVTEESLIRVIHHPIFGLVY